MMKLLVETAKRKFNRSVCYKFLAVFLLCLIIPLILLIQLFSYSFHSVLIEKEEADTSGAIRYITTQVSGILEEMDQIATALILDSKVMNILMSSAAAPGYEWFEEYQTLNNTLSLLAFNANNRYSITVIGQNRTLYQTAAVHNNNLQIDSPICRYIEEKRGKPVIFNRRLSGFDDNNMLCLGRAVYHKQKLLGIILTEVPSAALDAILNPVENPDTRMYLLHQSNEILYDTASLGHPVISPALEAALSGNADFVRTEDTEYLLMRQDVVKLPVSVIALVTKESVFHDSSLLLTRFIGAFACIIGITVIGMILMIRFFARDITTLGKEVLAFGENPEAGIPALVHTKDEIGRLTEGFLSMADRIKRLLARIREEEKNKRLLEFQALQAQINPHMIYNTLNTITYLAELQNVANIKEVSSSFASLLRSLSNVQGEYLTLAQELEYLKAYVAIKKYNLPNDVTVEYRLSPLAPNCYILKLLLQPIVENALIHGLSDQIEGGVIVIDIDCKQGRILIDITDNGRGMEEQAIAQLLSGQVPSGSTFLRVGIHNIIDRLQLQYEEDYTFRISSVPGQGTAVHLEYPAETKKEVPHDYDTAG